VELHPHFYNSQGRRAPRNVNQNFLDGIAKSSGLNFSNWKSEHELQSTQQVRATNRKPPPAATTHPTICLRPKGQAQPIVGNTDYGTLQSAIKSVS